VLITGESGTGKENFPKIIHTLSARKHGTYIAVNCGAIPEGTIDSELFGHEKGSFTGAHEARKGYFEVANGGTIFLDEVAELPLSTQVRLLRVLESGEFIRVGSSKVIKTNVRVVGATNIDVAEAIRSGKFREDLFYRLNNVPIYIPPLRERKDDIILLFRKFASDFAEKYRMPPIQLDPDAQILLASYKWPGNVRQLKNITEQMSIIESNRNISSDLLSKYLPQSRTSDLPVLFRDFGGDNKISERELLYKVLFDMRRDINDLKKLVSDIISGRDISQEILNDNAGSFDKFYKDTNIIIHPERENIINDDNKVQNIAEHIQDSEVIDEPMSLQAREAEIIRKVLLKHKGKRKYAAKELGISERTLYRKIKDYKLEDALESPKSNYNDAV
jgi:transcriptional regulator with PAS, ATPase and Fis domain